MYSFIIILYALRGDDAIEKESKEKKERDQVSECIRDSVRYRGGDEARDVSPRLR